MMTSQSGPLMVLICLVLVRSVMTSSDQVTWQPSKWLNEFEPASKEKELPMVKDTSEPGTKILNNEQLASCELRVKQIQLQQLNTYLQQQQSEHKKEIEIFKLKLKHSEETSVLKDEKLAALEETSRCKREFEDFNTALARLESKLREEFLQLKVTNCEDHKETRVELESQKIKFLNNQESTQSSIKLLAYNYTNLNNKITGIESQLSNTHNENNILKNLTASSSDDITNVKLEILQLNDKIFNISDQQTRYEDLQENKQMKMMQNITESLAIQNLETQTYAKKINESEIKIQNCKEEISNVIKITNKNVSDATKRIEEFEKKISLESKEISDIKNKLSKVEERLLRQVAELNMIQLGDHFYYFSQNKITWNDAQKFCRSQGLELAALETEEENLLVVKQWEITQRVSESWLDGTDEGSEGHWRWSSSGRALNYTKWYRPNPQPDGGTNENCMCLCSPSLNNNWCDCPCGVSRNYICKL